MYYMYTHDQLHHGHRQLDWDGSVFHQPAMDTGYAALLFAVGAEALGVIGYEHGVGRADCDRDAIPPQHYLFPRKMVDGA